MHKNYMSTAVLIVYTSNTSPGSRVSYLLHSLVDFSIKRDQVYSDAVVTTGIHAVCFLYINGAADNNISPPDVVLNDWPVRLTVTKPCKKHVMAEMTAVNMTHSDQQSALSISSSVCRG